MTQRQKYAIQSPFLIALAAFTFTGLIIGQSVYGQNRTANAARTRAEAERKSREIKKTVADHQRKVREQLNLPDATSRGPGAQSSLPAAESPRKDFKLPDTRSLAKSTGSGKKKNAVEYSPKRGQEFAFLVEMSTREGGLHKQWIGKPYFAGIFSDVGRSFAEMFCIGNLACRVRAAGDRPWSLASVDDVELPQSFMFGSSGVMNARTTSLFDQPTLPLQLSAILPIEELIFPRLPTFSDNQREESKQAATYYLRGGQKSFLGFTPTTTLDGESRRECRIEQETSTTPQIVNERGFDCPSQGVSLSFRQVGSIDAREGMIVNSDLDYLLKLDGETRLTVKVRRLYGDDLAEARAAALKTLPRAKWPEYFRRVPAEGDEFGTRPPRSSLDVAIGGQVCVSIDITERDAHGSRDYLALAIAGAPQGKVRVRLEGSQEELDVTPSSVRLPK